VIEPRIYRAAFLPAALALVLAMFSLQSRPPPLPQGLPADVAFAGPPTLATTASIVRAAPDRRPGTIGDRRVARVVLDAFRQRGFTTQVDRFSRDGKDLVNVVGRRAGRLRRQIVVVAARDASGVPDAGGSAADTAALIELARVFEGRPSSRTLVLASVDGATLGEVGVARLAGSLGDPELTDAVLVVTGLGAPTREAPAILGWSGGTSRAGLGLQRTAAESVREELGGVARGASATGQIARLALPLGIGGQAPLLDDGYDAVRISGDGELPDTGSTNVGDVDADRVGAVGRAVLRTVTALDGARRPEPGPRTYVTAVSQVMPGWVLSLLALALILPALVASIDAFARARRRREIVGPWLTWVAAGAGALVAGVALAHGLSLAGVTPEPPDAPVAPGLFPLDGAALAALGAVLAVSGLLWLALRYLAARAEPELIDPAAPGAAVAVSLTLAVGVLVLWLRNPFAALLAVPALHLWMLAVLVDPPPSRRARGVMIAAGLLAPGLVGLYHLIALGTDPLSGAWYVLLLMTGGHVGPLTTLVGCVILAALGCVVSIAWKVRAAPEETPPGPSVRGPGGYVGPGALGGTSSALPRR
jgi:hypothetical protein